MNRDPKTGGAEDVIGDPSDLSSQERCLLYLSDELSASEKIKFENELAGSNELADELVRQSELLVQLSVADPIAPFNTKSFDLTKSGSGRSRWIEVVVAIAACLLLGFFGYRLSSDPVRSLQEEDSLIARAWVDSGPTIGASDFELDFETEALPEDFDGASLSWVAGAVESGGSIDG